MIPVKPAIVYGDLTGEWPSSATGGLASLTRTVTLSSTTAAATASGVEGATSSSAANAKSALTTSDAIEFGGGVGATGDSETASGGAAAASGSLSPPSPSTTEMEAPNTERKKEIERRERVEGCHMHIRKRRGRQLDE